MCESARWANFVSPAQQLECVSVCERWCACAAEPQPSPVEPSRAEPSPARARRLAARARGSRRTGRLCECVRALCARRRRWTERAARLQVSTFAFIRAHTFPISHSLSLSRSLSPGRLAAQSLARARRRQPMCAMQFSLSLARSSISCAPPGSSRCESCALWCARQACVCVPAAAHTQASAQATAARPGPARLDSHWRRQQRVARAACQSGAQAQLGRAAGANGSQCGGRGMEVGVLAGSAQIAERPRGRGRPRAAFRAPAISSLRARSGDHFLPVARRQRRHTLAAAAAAAVRRPP